MKKLFPIMMALCLLLAGCGQSNAEADVADESAEAVETETAESTEVAEESEAAEPAVVVQPLPDTTMDNLTDAILSVSLEEGDAYVDDEGRMQMDLKIYSYDKYDMVDVAALKVGDTIVTHAGDVEVTAVERNDAGTVYINGGLEAGGFDLVTDDSGVFYETGYNDAKNWYEVGEATIRVSTEFLGTDNSDPEQGEVELYPGGFLVGDVTDYNFTPYNTTIRVEGGQVVDLDRIFTP